MWASRDERDRFAFLALSFRSRRRRNLLHLAPKIKKAEALASALPSNYPTIKQSSYFTPNPYTVSETNSSPGLNTVEGKFA